jgi:uncharacterized protein YjbJ (UPF0337 family)
MNKDQAKGRIDEAKGKAKEAACVILDDKAMETEGNVQQNIDKVQAGFGNLKEEIKEEIKKDIKEGNKNKQCGRCSLFQSWPALPQ